MREDWDIMFDEENPGQFPLGPDLDQPRDIDYEPYDEFDPFVDDSVEEYKPSDFLTRLPSVR